MSVSFFLDFVDEKGQRIVDPSWPRFHWRDGDILEIFNKNYPNRKRIDESLGESVDLSFVDEAKDINEMPSGKQDPEKILTNLEKTKPFVKEENLKKVVEEMMEICKFAKEKQVYLRGIFG